jgi:ketosteroid isomerase-like protein
MGAAHGPRGLGQVLELTSEHPNVALVRRGFEAMASGELEGAFSLFAPDLQYYGFDATGNQREFTSRDEFFGMVAEVMGHMDEFVTELVDANAVGDSLVTAHVRGRRRLRGSEESTVFEFAMVFRIEDGTATHAMDMIDARAEQFYKTLVATTASAQQ